MPQPFLLHVSLVDAGPTIDLNPIPAQHHVSALLALQFVVPKTASATPIPWLAEEEVEGSRSCPQASGSRTRTSQSLAPWHIQSGLLLPTRGPTLEAGLPLEGRGDSCVLELAFSPLTRSHGIAVPRAPAKP